MVYTGPLFVVCERYPISHGSYLGNYFVKHFWQMAWVDGIKKPTNSGPGVKGKKLAIALARTIELP